jgi:hypothetical protein
MSEKTVENYTEEMVATLEKDAPMDLQKAKAHGLAMGKSYRSIIAKCKREGIDYISKPAPAAKKKAASKADMVQSIADTLDVDVSNLNGLEKSTGMALHFLLTSISS